MLLEMQKLALCHLWGQLETDKKPLHKLRSWFSEERNTHGGRFFSYLIEPTGKVEKFYTLRADPDDPDVAVLEEYDVAALEGNPAARLPFNRPSGPQSPQIGPIIKRSYSKDKGAGPSIKILKSTLKSFSNLSKSDLPWGKYFREVISVFNRKKLSFLGNIIGDGNKTALSIAIDSIPIKNQTVYLVFKDNKDRLPGDVPEYVRYLNTMLDPDEKYTTVKVKGKENLQCSLCGKKEITGYASGCSAAGINISNIDRDGAFPGITTENAHLAFAICADCADLLFIFKFHVLNNYLAPIAGQNALLLPDLDLQMEKLTTFFNNFRKYTQGLSEKDTMALNLERRQLIDILTKSRVVTTIDIIWADFGQKMENIRGLITDILPSRLRRIQNKCKEFEKINNLFFPRYPLENFMFDVNLSFQYLLFYRPGGKKAKAANKSKKLFELKRLITEAMYKGKTIPEKRFWEEVMITAKWYLTSVFDSERPLFELQKEGFSEKKDKHWLTFAGWIKHLAKTLEYFKYMEVINDMENTRTYNPGTELLKPYFTEDSGIKDNHKAFAFLLGVLYGRVMSIQGAKGVNVSANALTWLKHLTLTGKDLPELFIKVREKLLAYGTEKSSKVRDVIHELGTLGSKLGDDIRLDQVQCCYFLLLGQSLSADIFSKDNQSKENSAVGK